MSTSQVRDAREVLQERIARFLELEEKALLSDAERIERDRLFSNKKMIAEAEAKLVSNAPELFSRDGLKQRFTLLSFLSRAMEWKDNPMREAIFDSVERIIESPTFRQSQNDEIKRSLVGDKMELYAELMGSDPSRATRLYERYQGTALQQILDYAAKQFAL